MGFLEPLEPLTARELEKLQVFEGEQARGLVHRPGYAMDMARLRQRWEAHPPQAHGLPDSVRISSRSPHVTGGASTTPEELEAISEEIDRNYAKDLVEDAPKHTHNFDRLHGLCRCGESREEINGHA